MWTTADHAQHSRHVATDRIYCSHSTVLITTYSAGCIPQQLQHWQSERCWRECLWCCRNDKFIARVYLVYLRNVGPHRASATPQTKPTNLLVCLKAAIVCTHHHHLLLLSLKADTCFTIPRWVEDWVNPADRVYCIDSIVAHLSLMLMALL